MSRVSSFGHQKVMLSNMLKSQSKVFTSQERVSSEKKFKDYRGYSSELTTLLGSKHVLTRVQDFNNASKHIKQVLDKNDLHVENIYKKVLKVKKTVVEAIAQDKTLELGDVLKASYESIVGSLNSSFGGRYSFSGSLTNQKPVIGASLNDLVAATNVADLFKNNKDKAKAKVDHGVTLEYGLVADEIAKEAFQAIKNIADYHAGAGGPLSGNLTGVQTTFLQGEIANLEKALSGLRETIAANGIKQKNLDTRMEDQKSEENFLKIFISDIEDVDMGEAIMNLNNNRLALKASYKIAGELKNLSLLNFL